MSSTKIVTVSTFQDACEKLVKLWQRAGKSKLVRIEGFDGVGKSGLAKLFCEFVGAVHLAADSFATKPETEKPYQDCIDKARFAAEISSQVASGKIVVLDAVCLDDVAPSSSWGRGFVVYVKRLSFNNRDPLWHGGFDLEGPSPEHEIRRSMHEYHHRSMPHLTADVIVEFPEKCHSISPEPYSRERCFDPPGAELI